MERSNQSTPTTLNHRKQAVLSARNMRRQLSLNMIAGARQSAVIRNAIDQDPDVDIEGTAQRDEFRIMVKQTMKVWQKQHAEAAGRERKAERALVELIMNETGTGNGRAGD